MGSDLPPTVAVLTDGGYILYDDMPGKLAVWHAFLPHVSLTYAEFEARFRPFKDRAQTVPGYGLDRAVADMGGALGLAAGTVAVGKRPRIAPRDGVVATLSVLKRHHVPIVVVSDSMDSREALRTKYHDVLGLGGLLTDIVSSIDVGAQKPHPAMWEAALRTLAAHGVARPSDLRAVAFVGHDAGEIAGAHAFGLRVLPCYDGGGPDLPFVLPGDRLERFSDLPARLGIES